MPPSAVSSSTASLAISFGLLFLAVMLYSIVSKGYTAFWQTDGRRCRSIFDAKIIDPDNKRATDPNVLIDGQLSEAGTQCAGRPSSASSPTTSRDREARRASCRKACARQLRDIVVADPSVIGTTQSVWVLAAANIDSAFKGQIDLTVDREPAARSPTSRSSG